MPGGFTSVFLSFQEEHANPRLCIVPLASPPQGVYNKIKSTNIREVALLRYTEELDWILDKVDTCMSDEEKYAENIAFVHSLGLKCDCVGWSKLDLADPRTPEILEKISIFCRQNNWRMRCYYTRQYIDLQSDWYELNPSEFKDSTFDGLIKAPSASGESVSLCVLKAFHELTPAPKSYGHPIILVPERFRNACLRCGIDDLDFCWAQDKGKYESEQYFHIYAKHTIPKIATDYRLDKASPDRIKDAGGWLPALANIVHKFQQINLPVCYLRSDLPETGIVQAQVVHKYQVMLPVYSTQLLQNTGSNTPQLVPQNVTELAQNTILIHKDIAAILLQEKALPASALRPAPVVDALPGGYMWESCIVVDRPTADFCQKMSAAYEKLKETPRPAHIMTEKDALKVLRAAKKDRKEDFQKALPRAKAAELADTAYTPLMSFYLVCNGGFLSEEYELLSYQRSPVETAEFYRALAGEELLMERPEGIVIAKCPDSDAVLLCNNGTVIRFSHEAPEVIDRWASLPQFIVDAVADSE